MRRPKPSRDELPPAARLLSQPVPLARPGSGGRTWLDVPYDEKDRAKSAGARWDPQARRWYAPGLVTAGLQRWAPLPQLLPGEDRSYGPGLFVDLVPSTCWFSNVRTCVQPASWHRIRTMVYGRAGERCEACGRPADRAAGLRMEAHERWAYDPARRVQSLRRLVCLCSACHGVTHLGRTQIMGDGQQALSHLRAVTGMSDREAHEHVQAAFALWEQRSAIAWELDLSILSGLGIALAAPAPDARAGIGQGRLQEERRRPW